MALPLARISILLVMLSFSSACHNEQPTGEHWGYKGEEDPSHWAGLSPEFVRCAEGHFQSPIDIESYASQKTDAIDLDFDYHACSLDIENNGHTIQANPEEDNVISYHGKTFHLRQFHFHEPSEHRLDGIVYPMEIHLVHSDSEGHLAVVGLFVKEGPTNSILEGIWANLPTHVSERTHTQKDCNIAGLLPVDKTIYHYSGSLTTPPCSEGVEWFLVEQPVCMSKEQIQRFRELYHANNRPVMPTAQRKVEYSG